MVKNGEMSDPTPRADKLLAQKRGQNLKGAIEELAEAAKPGGDDKALKDALERFGKAWAPMMQPTLQDDLAMDRAIRQWEASQRRSNILRADLRTASEQIEAAKNDPQKYIEALRYGAAILAGTYTAYLQAGNKLPLAPLRFFEEQAVLEEQLARAARVVQDEEALGEIRSVAGLNERMWHDPSIAEWLNEIEKTLPPKAKIEAKKHYRPTKEFPEADAATIQKRQEILGGIKPEIEAFRTLTRTKFLGGAHQRKIDAATKLMVESFLDEDNASGQMQKNIEKATHVIQDNENPSADVVIAALILGAVRTAPWALISKEEFHHSVFTDEGPTAGPDTFRALSETGSMFGNRVAALVSSQVIPTADDWTRELFCKTDEHVFWNLYPVKEFYTASDAERLEELKRIADSEEGRILGKN